MGRSWEKWSMKFLFLFILLLSCGESFAQSAGKLIDGTIASGVYAPRNYVKNPSGFKNTLGITVSSATIARDTDTADKLDGIASLVCDASSQNGYCLWSLDTIQEGDKTGNCEFKVTYKGDASLYKLRITDTSSTLTDSSVLANVTDWTEASINYPCGSTRDVRLVQTESGTGAAVNVGRVYYGKATNISSGTGYIGSPVSFTPTGSWSTNTTYTGQYRIVGNEAEFTINLALAGAPTSANLDVNLPSGFVIDTAKLILGNSSEVMGSDVQVFDNGVSGYSGQVLYIGNTGSLRVAYNTVSGSLLTITSVTQAAPMTFTSGDAVWMRFKVPIVGLGSNTSVSVSTNPFFTEWAAGTCASSWTANTTTTCKWRRVADSMEIEFYNVLTGAPTATGLTFSLPSTSCNGGQCTIDTAKFTTTNPWRAIGYGTGVSAATSVTINGTYSSSTALGACAQSGSSANNHICNVVSATNPYTFASGDYVSLRVVVPIVGWTAPQSVVPILVGSVSSNSTGALRFESAVLNAPSGGSCTVNRQSGSWISGTPSSADTGRCKITFTTAFTTAPTCICSAPASNTCKLYDITTTYFEYINENVAGSGANDSAHLICTGPR